MLCLSRSVCHALFVTLCLSCSSYQALFSHAPFAPFASLFLFRVLAGTSAVSCCAIAAHAKLMFREAVTVQDACVAVSLMESSMQVCSFLII